MFVPGPPFWSGGNPAAGAAVLLHFDTSTQTGEGPVGGGYQARFHTTPNAANGATTCTIIGQNQVGNPFVTSDCEAAAAKFGPKGLRLNEYQTEGSFSCSRARIDVVSNMDVALGQPFTLDFWHNKRSQNAYGTSTTVYCVSVSATPSGGPVWALTSGLYSGTAGQHRYKFEGLANSVETPSHVNDSVYHNIRVTRDAANTLRIFFDGVLEGTAFSATGALTAAGYFAVGSLGSGDTLIPNNYGSGDYDEVLWLPGVCLSTASYTPNTGPWLPP